MLEAANITLHLPLDYLLEKYASYETPDQVSSIKFNTTSPRLPGSLEEDAASLGSTALMRSMFHMVGL